MPYIQLDVNKQYPAQVKQQFAQRVGEAFARLMIADVRRVTVAIREVGEGAIWRCTLDEPVPAALLMCDIRRGRTPQQRAALASALLNICTELLELEANAVNVEFTQHAGDEMYHPAMGGLSEDWNINEV
jgi:phenylpyruvate tautomerase PptA (4-oxalocrotonate tautomerase family)